MPRRLGKTALMNKLSGNSNKPLTNAERMILIESLWRDELALYAEKFNKNPELNEFGLPIDPFIRSSIAATILNGFYLGQSNLIESNRSAAIGQGLNTKSFMELLIGAYATIATGQDPAAWVATDRLMALGNGPDADHRSLAYEVFKSGLLKLFNAIIIGDFAHGESTGIPGAIRFHESVFQGFLVDAWLTFLTDAASDGKTYGRKDGAWIEIVAGADGREIEISTAAGYIVWRYVGDVTWTNLVDLATLEGDPGAPGDDGREIEISTAAGYIVWRYVGDVAWTNLVDLATLEGAPGDDGISSYTYVAYASDNAGSGWSLTPTNLLKYRAEVHSTTALTPIEADFAGATWVKYLGDDGASANESVQALSGTSVTWDADSGINAAITLSGNTTITLSNLVAGKSGNLTVTNPATVYALTFVGYTNKISPAIYSAANQVKTSGSSKIDCVSWYYDGTYLIWNGTQDYK